LFGNATGHLTRFWWISNCFGSAGMFVDMIDMIDYMEGGVWLLFVCNSSST
jgi:hypothetical protein